MAKHIIANDSFKSKQPRSISCSYICSHDSFESDKSKSHIVQKEEVGSVQCWKQDYYSKIKVTDSETLNRTRPRPKLQNQDQD